MTRRQRVRSLEYRTRRAARHARGLEGATTKLTEFYAAAGAPASGLPPVPPALAAEVDHSALDVLAASHAKATLERLARESGPPEVQSQTTV